MALAPQDIVRVRLPALYASADLNTYLEMAEERTSTSVGTTNGWKSDTTRSMAVALRAMHEYSLDQSRPLGEAGAIAAKREGELSIEFSSQARSAKIAPPDIDLSQTAFGQQLLGLMRGSFIKVGVVGGEATALSWEGDLWM